MTVTTDVGNDGLVPAVYKGGKGYGKHKYRGLETGAVYTVTYNQTVLVDPRDTIESEDLIRVGTSLLVYSPPKSEEVSPQKSEEPKAPAKKRTAKKTVVKKEPIE